MKYLEIEALEQLNTRLSHIETTDSIISGRVEAYSCKQTGVDRKLKKVIDSRYTEEPAQPQPHEGSPDLLPPPSPVSPELGPSPLETIVSPFGPLYESTSRKTLVYLLGTLNASYDDYDFSDVKPENFAKLLHPNLARAKLVSNLAQGQTSSASIAELAWSAVDDTVNIADCDVYEFRPEEQGTDPYGDEAVLWSFHYFFFNRKMKRMVYLTARAVSPLDTEANIGGTPPYSLDWDDDSMETPEAESPVRPRSDSPAQMLKFKRTRVAY